MSDWLSHLLLQAGVFLFLVLYFGLLMYFASGMYCSVCKKRIKEGQKYKIFSSGSGADFGEVWYAHTSCCHE